MRRLDFHSLTHEDLKVARRAVQRVSLGHVFERTAVGHR
jgi:hypothetical protein